MNNTYIATTHRGDQKIFLNKEGHVYTILIASRWATTEIGSELLKLELILNNGQKKEIYVKRFDIRE